MTQALDALIRKRVTSVPAALKALEAMRRQITSARTYEELRSIERAAEALKILFSNVEQVKHKAEDTIIDANTRIGEEIKKVPKAKGGGQLGKNGFTRSGKSISGRESTGLPGTSRARLIKLAEAGEDAVHEAAKALRSQGKDVTPRAVATQLAADQTKKRRQASRQAKPLPNGADYRIGDCREVLADIADNSVPLILTDPPYGREAEPLYRWLAEWSARVLIPGGSLICFTGQSMLDRDMAILSGSLRYWWQLIMLHDQSQRIAGKFVMAEYKPILWYVKKSRRGRTLVPDILHSPARDKSQHEWGQGQGGIWPVIEHLSDEGELIVDPFAGTGTWGEIAAKMGRRWLGVDVVRGGDTRVVADELEAAE